MAYVTAETNDQNKPAGVSASELGFPCVATRNVPIITSAIAKTSRLRGRRWLLMHRYSTTRTGQCIGLPLPYPRSSAELRAGRQFGTTPGQTPKKQQASPRYFDFATSQETDHALLQGQMCTVRYQRTAFEPKTPRADQHCNDERGIARRRQRSPN